MRSVRALCGFMVMAAVGVLPVPAAIAAEEIVLTYRRLEFSLSIDELSAFAETGEMSRSIKFYMEASNQKPKRVRRILTREVEADAVLLDRILNSFAGEYLLDQISTVIHTPSGGADRQAMRSAIVLSASDDNRVSLIEVLENYPTEQIYVEGDRLESAYRNLRDLSQNAIDIIEQINPF